MESREFRSGCCSRIRRSPVRESRRDRRKAPVAIDTELALRVVDADSAHSFECGTKRSRWSRRVTETSNALDLAKGVFSKRDPSSIARTLKRSADRSVRRKSNPYRSAMSMLTFYINRAGKQLTKSDRHRLEQAKDELRRVYRRPGRGTVSSRS